MAVALALAAGILLLGLHHHQGGGSDHGCVYCQLSHTPVLPFLWLGCAAAILLTLWRIFTATVRFHREFSGCILALRAPPLH